MKYEETFKVNDLVLMDYEQPPVLRKIKSITPPSDTTPYWWVGFFDDDVILRLDWLIKLNPDTMDT